MLTYNNDPQLKADFVAEVRRHQDEDQIIQSTYSAVHSFNAIRDTHYSLSDHAALETAGLWPEWLARLEDRIFEGLPCEQAMGWPLRFAEAIPVGVDLEPVKWEFCAYLMKENIERVLALDISVELKEEVVSAIRGILQLHETVIEAGEHWSAAESAAWSAAESAAESAAWSAWSAAESAAESAAWSAAESARFAAESAARSVAWSARSAARFAAYEKYATKLVALLRGGAASTI